MMVSLKKVAKTQIDSKNDADIESTPLREYTPVHIREEYVPSRDGANLGEGQTVTYSEKEAKLMYEIGIESIHNENIPSSAEDSTNQIALPQADLQPVADCAKDAGITYSAESDDNCEGYLNSVFERSDEDQVPELENILKAIHKQDIMENIFSAISIASGILMIGSGVSLIDFMMHSSSNSSSEANPVTITLVLISMVIFGISMILWEHIPSAYSDKVAAALKSKTAVYISHWGAGTNKTLNALKSCKKELKHEVIRPAHCEDTAAFNRVIKDEHDVYIIYSKQCKTAVILDPMLYK